MKVLALLACGLLLGTAGCSRDAPEPPRTVESDEPGSGRPNILLIIGDDHGYRDFGFMGHPIVQTPNLDSLARSGTVFTHAFNTSSECRRSLASLLTGLHPHQYNVRNAALADAGRNVMPFGEIVHHETLPRLLGQQGYTTFQAGKLWEGTFAMAGFSHGTKDRHGRNWMEIVGGEGLRIGRETMQPVWGFLDEAETPFFIWFAPLLPHEPHDAPQRFVDLYADDALSPPALGYYAAISWFDAAVGQLMERLRADGLLDQTLVVYLSDNGWDQTPQGDRIPAGDVLKPELTARGKFSLYEQGFRTPLVFSWPGRIPAGVVRDDLVSSVDLFPTLLDFGGVAVPPGRTGFDLRPTLEEGSVIPQRRVVGTLDYAHVHMDHRPDGYTAPDGLPERGFFLRDEDWHYIAYEGTGIEALYDVRRDPDQTRDVSSLHPEVVARLRKQVEAWLDEQAATVADVAPR